MINQPNQINLDRLLDTAFVLASGREDKLYRIANGTTVQAAFARVMLTILTDTIFPIESPLYMAPRSVESAPQPYSLLPAKEQLQLIPNPANGAVKVVLPKGMTEAQVSLFDLRGRLMTTNSAALGESIFYIDAYPEGIYFLHAGDGSKRYNAKLIIER